MTAWFDGAHLARQLQAPVVGLGCGTPGCAHSSTEYAGLDDLYAGARAVALAVRRFLQAPPIA
jgi:acetylornithine deacetylase/succinyl-diaminopimelate desuccinylase-like protein